MYIWNISYSVIGKLGWGRWLARDLQRRYKRTPRYVSIKFNNCDVDQESTLQERALLERLTTADPGHPGHQVVRKAIDSFDLIKESGTHLCLVHEPLRETLEIFRRRFSGSRLPLPLLKAYVKILLVGLDYLHDTCQIIHTGKINSKTCIESSQLTDLDLKLDNILVSFEDESVLSEQAERLQQTDQPFKKAPERRVYQSQNNFGPMRSLIVAPVIADFGSAVMLCFGATPIQPDGYRAPEVLLGWGWSTSVDIWNLGNLIWKLASGADFFTSIHSATGKYDAVKHLALMFGTLGPPDPALISKRSQGVWKWSPPIENDRGEQCEDASTLYGGPFFDSSGRFLHMDALQSLQSLAQQTTFIDGAERAYFADFVGKMLRWDLEQRPSAEDLLTHQWLDSRAT